MAGLEGFLVSTDLAMKAWRWPVMSMSTSRSRLTRTGRWVRWAARAAVHEMKTERVSFPPKAPPMRLTRHTTCRHTAEVSVAVWRGHT